MSGIGAGTLESQGLTFVDIQTGKIEVPFNFQMVVTFQYPETAYWEWT